LSQKEGKLLQATFDNLQVSQFTQSRGTFTKRLPSKLPMNPHPHGGQGGANLPSNATGRRPCGILPLALRIRRETTGLVLLLALTTPCGAASDSADASNLASTSTSTSPVAPAPSPARTPSPRTAKTRLSPEIANQIKSSLPAWSPQPAHTVANAPQPPPTTLPADPEVVKMAPVIVKAPPLPRTDRLDWLSPHAKDMELVKTYITPFDRYFLSRFTLPLFGSSQEARARSLYEEDKRLKDLSWINEQIKQVERLDPEEARALQGFRNTTFSRTDE
jgi:hypothetical protein